MRHRLDPYVVHLSSQFVSASSTKRPTRRATQSSPLREGRLIQCRRFRLHRPKWPELGADLSKSTRSGVTRWRLFGVWEANIWLARTKCHRASACRQGRTLNDLSRLWPAGTWSSRFRQIRLNCHVLVAFVERPAVASLSARTDPNRCDAIRPPIALLAAGWRRNRHDEKIS